MDQRAINEAEWSNPANWTGARWLSVYFSKRDSRALVPKRVRAMGWTVNLGQPAGVGWFLGIVAGTILMTLGAVVGIASVCGTP